MDIILIIAILVLIFGGVGAVSFLGELAWILVVVAVIVIAWRIIAGRSV
jgi:hypothetical protein